MGYTFKPETPSGVSDGLNPNFELPTGVSTVYFGKEGKATGNWDHSTDDEPTLGGVVYDSFYTAYGSLLGSDADSPWSSRAFNNNDAYYWVVSDTWNHDNRNYGYAVVLAKTL